LDVIAFTYGIGSIRLYYGKKTSVGLAAPPIVLNGENRLENNDSNARIAVL
jgi:hypothetical protein